MTEKIYVHLIDGSDAWVPIEARQIDRNKYLILDDSEYTDNDPSVLFEYYPGDIVEVEDSLEEEYQFKASKLITPSNRPDRKYFLFKFKSTLRLMPTSIDTAEEFKDEIKRIKDEITTGQFVYRGIKETIKFIDNTTARNGSC